MKILRRKLLDEISELDGIAMNHDFNEGLYTIDITASYEEILEKLEGLEKIIFMPEAIMERELNKRFIDLIAEAGIQNIILVLPDLESSIRETEVLEKYIKDYGGLNYMVLKVPQLMDEIFEYFVQGRIPKTVERFSVSSIDAFDVLEKLLSLDTLSNEVISLKTNYFENTANYREVFDQPQSEIRMRQLKTNPFKEYMGRDLLTWEEFVKIRKLN